MKRFAAIITTLLLLSACGGGSNGSEGDTPIVPPAINPPVETQPSDSTYTRTIDDQPDVSQDQHTIHVVYAVPKGNEDLERDKTYELQTSVLAADNWFKAISNGKQLKLDLQENGDLDVTYWALSVTNTELRDGEQHMRDVLEAKIKETNWYNPNKLYAVYFEGSHQNTCGDASTTGGHIIALYLHNATENPAYNCSNNQLSSSVDSNGYVEHVLIHEVVHALGVAHTTDSNKDLMYAGSEPWQPEILDLNNDDYFMHSDTNKVDILFSTFLKPNDGDDLPPNWESNN
ncbi:matrixin family metalloprotease [Flocculibacter collagenilyticus]|uniref:matrixin family metalloprotease n=1 Tax=Flocculibacter collagenilyticus TaxID=2744479 RepID=UPI0018F5FC94|nr:matrixin family metalloprotease [Flocculibacter collagenilyticus]